MSARGWHTRLAGDGDQGFIIGAWLRSYRERSRRDAWIPDELYGSDRGQRGIIMRCLETTPTRVAQIDVPGGEPELIGFLCGSGPWLHFVYVKKAFRSHGICRTLLEDAGVTRGDLQVSHATGTWFLEHLQRKWCARVAFNPYEMRP